MKNTYDGNIVWPGSRDDKKLCVDYTKIFSRFSALLNVGIQFI